MSRRNPIVRHPRLGFSITASDRGYPDFDGAVCTSTDPEIWYYSNFDSESEYRTVEPIEIAGWTAGYATTNAILASICENCPVLKECFNYALYHEYHGFWGGTTQDNRKRLRRQHRIIVSDISVNFLNDRMIKAARNAHKEVSNEESFDKLVHPLDQ